MPKPNPSATPIPSSLAPWLKMLSDATTTPANQGEDALLEELMKQGGSGDAGHAMVSPEGPRVEQVGAPPAGKAIVSPEGPRVMNVSPPEAPKAPPIDDTYNGPHAAPYEYGQKQTIKPLGTFEIHSREDLNRLKSAKTPEDLEAIKQDLIKRGAGKFTPAN